MFFADGVSTSSKESISLLTVKTLQGCKNSDVTRLKLIKRVEGETAEDNIVFETKF
jgi:hypothetical protein